MTTAPAGRRSEPQRTARGRGVRTITLGPWAFRLCATITPILALWLIASTTYLLFHHDIREATQLYQAEKHRIYEDRIAELRRRIDHINSRQFLDQEAFDKELAEVRHRQALLEERQLEVAGLLDAGERHGLTVQLDGASVTTGSVGAGFAATSVADSAPRLATRPHPAGIPDAQPVADPRDPAGSTLGAMRRSLDRVSHIQQKVLDALEYQVQDKVEHLVTIPEAIGAPMPDATGLGGPLVELRGADGTIETEDQITRIESAIDRLDMLKEHIWHLPVRVPVAAPARVSSGYGSRIDPFVGRRAMHTGLDFRAGHGTPVVAAAAGRVVKAGRMGGYGKLVEIDHGNGYTTRYAHLSSILVERGQSVDAGATIGKVGSTGRSTGAHLHYETRVKGRPANPSPFVAAAKLLPTGY